MYVENGPLMMAQMVHPLEYETELECQKNGIYNWLADFTAGIKMNIEDFSEQFLESYIATEKTSPRLYRLYTTAIRRLDSEEIFPLFVKFGYELSACVHGSDSTGSIIIINSACLDELSDSELIALLGQQIGHIKAGHIKNIEFLDVIQNGIEQVPVIGNIIGKKIWSYFAKWIIFSKYTADRAAVIASGSIEAVISLLCKQMGATLPETPLESIGNEVISKPEEFGVYFVWLAQSVTAFAAVERINELKVWSKSPEFRERFPYMYYMARLCFDEKATDASADELLLLHRRADNGNYIAAGILGEAYLFGKKSLPPDGYTAISLLKAAAYNGDGRSMYLLSVCAETGYANFKKDEALSYQLLRASGSRFEKAKSAADKLKRLPSLSGIDKIVIKFLESNTENLKCVINTDFPGQPVDNEISKTVRNAFWMLADEPLYVFEIRKNADEVFGIAIAESGIYGRLEGEATAYCINWNDFAEKSVVKRHDKDADWFFCDKKKFYRCPDELKGTAGEILIKIKSALNR